MDIRGTIVLPRSVKRERKREITECHTSLSSSLSTLIISNKGLNFELLSRCEEGTFTVGHGEFKQET